MAFAVLTVLALLPLGVKSNQISAEESRAICIMTTLESDLRNTHPLANAGKSALLGLTLPYEADAVTGTYTFNSLITSATTSLVEGETTVGLDEGERVKSFSGPRPQYQVSVIYTVLPAVNSMEVLQARLLINWPAQPGASIVDLTNLEKVRGFVETTVSFPAP
jgi:hypothetical protein